MFAVEVGRQDGPFDNPEGSDLYKRFNEITLALSPTSNMTIGESSYSGNWHGSGQIPARAVERGSVGCETNRASVKRCRQALAAARKGVWHRTQAPAPQMGDFGAVRT